LQNEFSSFDVDYGAYDLIAALKKLQKKRGDILIETTEVTHYTIKKLNLKNKIIEVPNVKIETLEFKLLISNKSPFTYLIPKIDNVLIQMESDGTLDAIYKKYR
jgi:ABC-type amino acid transport substrate-binding protein